MGVFGGEHSAMFKKFEGRRGHAKTDAANGSKLKAEASSMFTKLPSHATPLLSTLHAH
jgi:hypothetical protein